MIRFQGGPLDGEDIPDEFLDFDEVHIQNDENSPVYIYMKDDENMCYSYEGEFSSDDIYYKEDEDE
jgi:hypothetical protein